MRKEINMGNGLYKYVEETLTHTLGKTINAAHPTDYTNVEWRIVELEGGGFIRRPFKIQTESQKMQDELEPIWHPTQHDESDDIEHLKKYEELSRPVVSKLQVLKGPDKKFLERIEKYYFSKGEKWEHKKYKDED